MKEVITANCEKAFISQIIANKLRLDGRDSDEFRSIKINFGNEWGSVVVALGGTRVLAQVTCEVVQPKSTRPNEGLLFLKVELGPMAAPHFEANRLSDMGVQVNRILERAFKDSRCVDLESLCIVAEEKVWNLRVDLNVLNHEGNIIDCASIAALTALIHFKRPDVTTSGDEVIIHTHAERDPIPLVLHHYPVCISYAIFNKGEIAIADPTHLEEKVAEASLVFGLNSYRELCGLHFGGITLASSTLLLQCANRGADKAKLIVYSVKDYIKNDAEFRASAPSVGCTDYVRPNQILRCNRLAVQLKRFDLQYITEILCDEQMEKDDDEENKIVSMGETSAVLLPQRSKWVPDSESEEDEKSNDEEEHQIEKNPVEIKKEKKTRKRRKKNKNKAPVEEMSYTDSEEDETVTLESTEHIR